MQAATGFAFTTAILVLDFNVYDKLVSLRYQILQLLTASVRVPRMANSTCRRLRIIPGLTPGLDT